MDDKRAIIDEVLAVARIYLDENTAMVINTVHDFNDIPESCSKCNEPLDEIYFRPESQVGANGYYLFVLKCEKCSRFYSFWKSTFTFDDTFTPTKEDMAGRIIEPPKWEYRGKSEWGEGKQPKFSKKIAQVYKKTVAQLEDIDKKLTPLIQNKQAELYSVGLSVETIHSARNKMSDYLKNNSVTQKQLTSLFAAAIYEASHEESIGAEGYRRVGEGIGECQLEKLFGVTRKTIRRWRSLLINSILANFFG